MSASSFGLDAFTTLRSRAIPDRVSNEFADDAASRASMGIDRDMNAETLDLGDEVLLTTMFDLPGLDGVDEVVISGEVAEGRAEPPVS